VPASMSTQNCSAILNDITRPRVFPSVTRSFWKVHSLQFKSARASRPLDALTAFGWKKHRSEFGVERPTPDTSESPTGTSAPSRVQAPRIRIARAAVSLSAFRFSAFPPCPTSVPSVSHPMLNQPKSL
jgi:hypothetical protein